MPGLAQSTSFHQLARASEPWGPALTYAFLSPVFDSISKPGYPAAGFTSAEVRRVASAPGAVPLIALGGVTEGNLAAAAGLGFAGAAVLGGVWHRADPVAAVEALLRVCRGLREQGTGDGEGRGEGELSTHRHVDGASAE
jgi:thiamine-phosphate pyrophosphorylase